MDVSSDFPISDMMGKSVIELGSGCGLAGLAFLLRGASVVLTDLAAVVQNCTKPNAQVQTIS